jgi:hypothetical protein
MTPTSSLHVIVAAAVVAAGIVAAGRTNFVAVAATKEVQSV